MTRKGRVAMSQSNRILAVVASLAGVAAYGMGFKSLYDTRAPWFRAFLTEFPTTTRSLIFAAAIAIGLVVIISLCAFIARRIAD